MKLRIKGNSLRMRLTQSEVNQINAGKAVRETIHFAPGAELNYQILSSREVSVMTAKYSANEISVLLPEQVALAWASGDEVALKNRQPLGGDDALELLIEKDFFCLKPREHQDEDESDMFPNPNVERGSCG